MSVTEQAVPGAVIPSGSMVSPGGGQGVQGIQGPTAVSADSGNIAQLGSDNLILVPQSQIWSARLRSFSSVGNGNFDVDQRNCFGAMNNSPTGTFLQDRWIIGRGGTMSVNWQAQSTGVTIPGTSFVISTRPQRCTLVTQQTTLGATDTYGIYQAVEGQQWRELGGDVTSISLLVRSSVASLKFSVSLRDSTQTYSLVKLCTTSGTANTWTLITLPNIPVPGGGTFNYAPGTNAYILGIFLSVGSTYIAPAADTWQSNNFVGAPGMSNFCGQANGSTFDIGYISHEPGSQCSNPPLDIPWIQNYEDCLRYFQKTYDYGVTIPTATANGYQVVYVPASQHPYGAIPFKKNMAKLPTAITGYDPTSGGGGVRDLIANVNRSISSILAYGQSGFAGFGVSTFNAAATLYGFHYTVDTGW